MRAELSVAAALTVVYQSAHVKGAVQESRGNRATHELSCSFLIRELQQEKAWTKTRDTCTRNQTSRKAEIPTWIALPKVATNFLPCPSRKNGRSYSAPQLKSHLWDWGPCENYLKRAIKTSLLLYLTPPQVLHTTLMLTQPLWDSNVFSKHHRQVNPTDCTVGKVQNLSAAHPLLLSVHSRRWFHIPPSPWPMPSIPR